MNKTLVVMTMLKLVAHVLSYIYQYMNLMCLASFATCLNVLLTAWIIILTY